jgi:hypothetical protein
MEVRILHISDVHCADHMLEPLLRGEEYDVLVVSGDLECTSTARLLATTSRAPVLAVTGNLDTWRVRDELERLGMLLDGRTARLLGYVFAGVGGLETEEDLDNVDRTLFHILVSHHPPMGILDKGYYGRGGLARIRRLIEEKKPLLHMFGHIHEARGVEEQGNTVFVNPGPLRDGYYAVVRITDKGVGAKLKHIYSF